MDRGCGFICRFFLDLRVLSAGTGSVAVFFLVEFYLLASFLLVHPAFKVSGCGLVSTYIMLYFCVLRCGSIFTPMAVYPGVFVWHCLCLSTSATLVAVASWWPGSVWPSHWPRSPSSSSLWNRYVGGVV